MINIIIESEIGSYNEMCYHIKVTTKHGMLDEGYYKESELKDSIKKLQEQLYKIINEL
jgi:hypothetical protein